MIITEGLHYGDDPYKEEEVIHLTLVSNPILKSKLDKAISNADHDVKRKNFMSNTVLRDPEVFSFVLSCLAIEYSKA